MASLWNLYGLTTRPRVEMNGEESQKYASSLVSYLEHGFNMHNYRLVAAVRLEDSYNEAADNLCTKKTTFLAAGSLIYHL